MKKNTFLKYIGVLLVTISTPHVLYGATITITNNTPIRLHAIVQERFENINRPEQQLIPPGRTMQLGNYCHTYITIKPFLADGKNGVLPGTFIQNYDRNAFCHQKELKVSLDITPEGPRFKVESVTYTTNILGKLSNGKNWVLYGQVGRDNQQSPG